MKDAQKPDHKSLNQIISMLKEGKFQIPDFQRDFEWRPWDITELMKSIFLDYYIGSLLLWKGKPENFKALSCQPVYGHSGAGDPMHIVLDGQQRLTAMHYAFLAPDHPLPNRKNRAVYFLDVSKFMNEEYDEAFRYEWLNRRVDKILEDRELQYAEHIFPLSVAGRDPLEQFAWFTGYKDYWAAKEDEACHDGDEERQAIAAARKNDAADFSAIVLDLLGKYQISYIELDQDIPVAKVCDIFTQINSRGIRLDIFDLLNAMLVPKGFKLRPTWHEVKDRLSFANSDKMNVYVLQVMSILAQNYCSPKYLYYLVPEHKKTVRSSDGSKKDVILIKNTEEFKNRWEKAVNAIEKSLQTLRSPHEFGVSSSRYLPYVSIIPVFSAIQVQIQSLDAPLRLEAQRKARLWYWSSVFLNRYSGSVESTAARDFIDFGKWASGSVDEPAPIVEFKQRFSTLDLLKETKRGSSVYNGVFNLLVLAGAKDWISGIVPHGEDLDDHHIVPASWGKEMGLGSRINTILNRTPLSSDTNRNIIRGKLPNEYLPDLIEKNGLDRVLRILESHFISKTALDVLLKKPFSPSDFDEFISLRNQSIQEAIESLIVKERLDLPEALRVLDADIEEVEISLRSLINKVLEGDPEKLPSGVLDKARGLIDRASKRSPAFDRERYATLDGLLEYTDLRGLQDIITNKGLWGSFEPVFLSKEETARKFGQLADLRNGIAHNRSVDTICKKEGEASILWFTKAFGGGNA